MPIDTKNELLKDRTRYLNIVYFVESARSHTIRINLKYARWAMGVVCVVFVWAVASIFWVATLEFQVYATRERLASTLATIFDYQIKNDKVFDVAYPPEETNSYYSEAAHLASNSPIDENNLNHTKNAKQTTNNPTPAAVVTADANQMKKAESAAAPIDSKIEAISAAAAASKTDSSALTKQGIGISNAKVIKAGAKFTLDFDISNPNQQKAEGYIWAVASIKAPDGKSQFLAAPHHSKINTQDGRIEDVKSTYRFSIQRFKNKTFDFATASEPNSKLASMKIYYTDLSGAKPETINVPVEQIANSENGKSEQENAQ